MSVVERAEEQVYDAINSAWDQAGLARCRVKGTPGWERAEAALRRYCEGVGWHAPPMGPGNRATWFNWLHILSHTLDDGSGHSLAHAKLELHLTKLVINALARPS